MRAWKMSNFLNARKTVHAMVELASDICIRYVYRKFIDINFITTKVNKFTHIHVKRVPVTTTTMATNR